MAPGTRASNIGRLLNAHAWPRLLSFHLHYASLTLADLKEFLGGLQRTGQEMALSLVGLQLVDGGWSDALDVLRTKAPNNWVVSLLEG